MNCDKCGKNIKPKNAWVSWYWDCNTRKTSAMFITCHPSTCHHAAAIEDECPKSDHLMDHEAMNIAHRFVSWANDYNIAGRDVARLAVFVASDISDGVQALRMQRLG